MDHPYLPPAAEPSGPRKPRSRDEKIRRSALILSCGAMVVGAGLLYFFASRGGFGEFISDLSLPELPWSLGQILKTKPEAPIFVGMAVALLAVLFAQSPLTRIALALGLIAVVIIFAWAAAAFCLLMKAVSSMAG